jgi:aminoglycoside phosphotransferase (APT) family kinase protein
MPARNTHTDKVNIDASLVRRLIAAQFPQWAALPVTPIEFGGWDHRTFPLGADMTVRLPSAAAYSQQVEKEQHWLPRLAPFLPLAIPRPLAMGKPAEGYPWNWSVYRWIDGETATIERIADLRAFATTLAEFLAALQRINATGGPKAGPHNFHRGGKLTTYDAETRQAIAALDGRINTDAVMAVWEAALASEWQLPPVWLHGDISVGNLLVKDGRLCAVIDFGSSGVGDPACDLVIAWRFLRGESRDVFRAVLPLDRRTWARGRGWALWKALIVAAGLPGTDPNDVDESRRVIDEIFADHDSAV